MYRLERQRLSSICLSCREHAAGRQVVDATLNAYLASSALDFDERPIVAMEAEGREEETSEGVSLAPFVSGPKRHFRVSISGSMMLLSH